MADAAVKDPGSLKWNPVNKRYALASQGKASSAGVTCGADEDDARDDDVDDVVTGAGGESQEIVGAPKIPTKHNPIIVTIYGQICIAARSYQSAICTSFKADSAFQNDVMCFVDDSLSSPRLRLLPR